MLFSTLISVEDLHKNFEDDHWVVVDCRFSLQDLEYGHRTYLDEHIPGAVYAHLEKDLSGRPATDNGRHPLPTPEQMVAVFGNLGIQNDTQVVVYDDNNGAIASRLWWMLRFMNHAKVAVLDGGWPAWKRAQFPIRSGSENKKAVKFTGQPNWEKLVVIDDVPTQPHLVDSRAPERYRGEIETIDPVAGHIPGARNYFYQNNWGEDGLYLSKEELKSKFHTFLGEDSAENVTFYCGSGVTACVNLLALDHTGLGMARLFVGSWGEWCRNPELAIASGG